MKSALLILLLCCAALTGWADIVPPRTQAKIDSLRTLLWHSKPELRRINLLLDVSQALIDRHDDYSTGLDSIYCYGKEAEALSTALQHAQGRIKSLHVLAYVRNAQADKAAARVLIKEAIALSKQQGFKQLEAAGWSYLGEMYDWRNKADLPSIKASYEKALALYRQLGDRFQVAQVLTTLAHVHLYVENNPTKTLQELLQVAATYRALRYRKIHYTYNDLLLVNRQLGNYQAALRYGLAAVESAKALQDTSTIGLYYTTIGLLYKDLAQPDAALVYYKKSFQNTQAVRRAPLENVLAAADVAEIYLLKKMPKQALDFFLKAIRGEGYDLSDKKQLGHSLVLTRLAECYSALGSYKLADRYYQQVLAVLESEFSFVIKRDSYYSAGKFYLLTGKYEQARTCLLKSLALVAQFGPVARKADLHLAFFKVDSAQARYPAAIAHYQRYKALNDSIFNEKTSRQVAGLQIEYDTHKKEQNIALLTKQNQVQQANLRQRELQRNATLGSVGLLILLLGVSYNRSRIIKRSTHLLEQKQLEINQKNQSLEQVLGEKDDLLLEKEDLLVEKEGLLVEKEGLLVEKEWMLKEIHHRVKNNLQIVSELLDSQLDQLQEPRTLAIIRESQNRVQAMALVHQKLYQSQNLARVDMQEYIRDIVEHLLTSFQCEQSVQEHLDIAAVELDVALATPLGLIINEAVTNSLKYAFPDARPGTISISLRQLPGQRYQLCLADDGVGLPAGFDMAATRTMGLTLIRGLSEQLEADLAFSQGVGAQICLEFESAKKAAHAEEVTT
jgi:two-component sensor histidine kinase